MIIDIRKIYVEIKNKIIDLTYPPNTLMKEETIAEEYKISRTPVRSVISRLVQRGLLVVKPKKGTYVSRISIKMIDNDAYIRQAVESKIIEDAIKNVTDADIQELKEILAEQEVITNMEPSIEKSKLFNENDNKFHVTIFRIAGHESLWQDMINSTINFDRVRIMSNLRSVPDVKKVYQYHCDIAKSLEEKNLEKAKEAFTKHIGVALDGIEKVKEKYKDYFVEEQL